MIEIFVKMNNIFVYTDLNNNLTATTNFSYSASNLESLKARGFPWMKHCSS